MIERYIDVGDGAWSVILCYGYDRRDYNRMHATLDSFGMSEYRIIEAMDVLRKPNTGMTVSRSDLTMSVVFVGRATSKEQFMDTLSHELDHVQNAIARHYDLERGSEEEAWLQGYLMREASRIVLPYVCD